MNDLRDLLERSTDGIDAPSFAGGALVAARRRRTRARAVVAVAATVAVVTGVALVGRIGEDGAGPQPAPAPVPTPAVSPTAPEIPRDRIQPVWDPRDAEGQPVVDLGVPRVMETLTPGTVDRPVAVLDDGTSARLVAGDGTVEELALPDGLQRWRTVSLSPDGTRLAVVGVSGFFWRPLDGDWREVPVGDHSLGEGIEVTWAPDNASLVLRGHLAGTHVDLETGDQARLPMTRNYASWTLDPDGGVVTTGRPGVREWVDGRIDREVLLGPLENLQRPVVSDASIAAARANVTWEERRRADDSDGLVALDRTTLETRGFLRVPYEASYYVDGGTLTPIDWLDDDTVLFTVLPKGAPKRYLMAWNVDTGDVSRISCWLVADDAVFATDLLARS